MVATVKRAIELTNRLGADMVYVTLQSKSAVSGRSQTMKSAFDLMVATAMP